MHRTLNSNMFAREIEENGSSTENSLGESPPSSGFNDLMIKTGPATSSPKRSRRAIQKRVVSIPIKDIEGSRLKGEGPPPSDSWAWRKYGQKPIKGSPYPRGYYRCSSSKGCPARKQVERSRDDPTMLLITYSCEHNHPWPAPRSNHHNSTTTSTAAEKVETPLNQTDRELEPGPEPEVEPEPEAEPETESMREEKFSDISEESAALMSTDVFGWFTGMDTTPSMILESPIFAESSSNSNGKSSARDEADVARFFPLREEDESLFADLGELPECSVVFRHSSSGGMSPQVQIC